MLLSTDSKPGVSEALLEQYDEWNIKIERNKTRNIINVYDET